MIGVGGGFLLEATPDELAGLPGRREVMGNIEVRRRKSVTWVLVKEDEGLVLAAHRALDLYMRERGLLWVKVVRKAAMERYVEGVEWELFMAFRPLHEEGPSSR